MYESEKDGEYEIEFEDVLENIIEDESDELFMLLKKFIR